MDRRSCRDLHHSYDAQPLAALGSANSTSVNLLDLLTNVYGDQVSSIAGIQIAYRDATYLANATPTAPLAFSHHIARATSR